MAGLGCCTAEENRQETNLKNLHETGNTSGVNIFMLIKCQAMFRGMLVRRRIRTEYGFTFTPGITNKGAHACCAEMDEEKLAE